MIKRRQFVAGSLLVPLAGIALWSPRASAVVAEKLAAAAAKSDLIYLTSLHRDGRESSCQSEIWFVADQEDFFVVTEPKTWRARAVTKGLTGARIWVGDLGGWKKTNGAYKKLPQVDATASLVTDDATHQRILGLYGDKYSMEWLLWGPRFKKGLADGTRTMIRYTPVQAPSAS